MNSTRSALLAITASLVASPYAHAATGSVDVYGIFGVSIDLVSTPSSGVFSAAADIGTNLFPGTSFVPTVSATQTSAQTAAITLTDYSAHAKTTLGSNHAYTQSNGFNNGAFGVNSFSGWYDQVTITGDTGTGTVQFSVQLNGVVDAGAYLGTAGFGLLASNIHPASLNASRLTFNALHPATPWILDPTQVTEIARYDIVASPFNDPNKITGLFGPATSPNPNSPIGTVGIPSIPDQIFKPGANQTVNTLLIGTFNFTYGEAFYLIGALETSIVGDGLQSFCPFSTRTSINNDPCAPTPKDGIGATTLDFSNSANLIGMTLPEGASASFASGRILAAAAIPEPSALALTGLGLLMMGLGRRITRRA